MYVLCIKIYVDDLKMLSWMFGMFLSDMYHLGRSQLQGERERETVFTYSDYMRCITDVKNMSLCDLQANVEFWDFKLIFGCKEYSGSNLDYKIYR